MMNGPNKIEIDLSALNHNLSQVRKRIHPGIRTMGIVKADAYGHGLVPISRTLEKNGVDFLGVAHLHEALDLRGQGITLPVAVLCGVRTREDCRVAVEKKITPVLFDLEAAEVLAQESGRCHRRTPIHLKVDTGMGRLGIPCGDVGPFVERIIRMKHLELEALTSHLSCADEPENGFTVIQIRRFREAVERVTEMGIGLPLNNLANSAGLLFHEDAHQGMVRIGIGLYGGIPFLDSHDKIELRPVMHFKGEVLQVREMPDGSPVSYGGTYHTRGFQKTAVLSAGYGDGLPRAMSNKGSVLVRNRRVPVIGRICMNMTICDVTGLADVKRGDEVVFLGDQGEESISAGEMARWADTISYEVLCSIGRQNERRTYLT
jgi:alanine racemase